MKPTPSSGRTIDRSVRDDGICVLTFDRPGSSANILDRDTLLELEEELGLLEREPNSRGVVLTSAKPTIFVSGADLNAFRAGVPLDEIHRFINHGQAVMNRLAALAVPTVAAIGGAALGGGCELALACDYRVATDTPGTRLGLPETQLGLVPAWGGLTRLPRLIGLTKAFELIATGKPVSSTKALDYGLIDELVPAGMVLEAAVRRIQNGKPRRSNRWLRNNPLIVPWNARFARRKYLSRSQDSNPAPAKALAVAGLGVWRPIAEALALECEAFMELVQTEVAHNLIELFFDETRARKVSIPGVSPAASTKPIASVAVIGAGVMGTGIAYWLTSRRVEVSLVDVDSRQLGRAMEHIGATYSDSVRRGTVSDQQMQQGIARVRLVPDVTALGAVDLVIEAAVEDLAVKQEIFRNIDQHTPLGAILATNTSALPIAALATATRRPSQVVGLHFFNPVHRMPLVEVIAAEKTAPDILQRAVAFAQRIGKLPVIVRDSPGFVANRLLTPYLNEAQLLFEQGVPLEQLDQAMLDFGLPMGPLRLLDEIGLDVELRIAETLAARFADHISIPVCLRDMVRLGWLGRKRGRGFYVYDGSKPVGTNPSALALVHGRTVLRHSKEELQERMLFAMINEAARCLEEEIVSRPEDIDFVMVKGTGFPGFRGGPLRYADSIGAARLAGAMEVLVDGGMARFEPCGLLRKLAADRKGFYNRSSAGQPPQRKAA